MFSGNLSISVQFSADPIPISMKKSKEQKRVDAIEEEPSQQVSDCSSEVIQVQDFTQSPLLTQSQAVERDQRKESGTSNQLVYRSTGQFEDSNSPIKRSDHHTVRDSPHPLATSLEYQIKIEELKQSITQLHLQLSILRNQFWQEFQKWYSKFQEDKKTIITTAKELDDQFTKQNLELSEYISRLEHEVQVKEESAQMARERYQRQVEEWEDTVKQMQGELKQMKDQLNNMCDQNETLFMKNKELQQSELELNCTQSEVQRLRHLKVRHESEIEELENKLSCLQQEASLKEKEIEDQNSDLATYQTMLETMYRKKFQQSIKLMQSEMEEQVQEQLEVEKIYYCRQIRAKDDQLAELNTQIDEFRCLYEKQKAKSDELQDQMKVLHNTVGALRQSLFRMSQPVSVQLKMSQQSQTAVPSTERKAFKGENIRQDVQEEITKTLKRVKSCHRSHGKSRN